VWNKQIALPKCTSAYPAPLEEINLKTIPILADTFKTVVGLSDHTLGIEVPIATVALGARIIEKHFTLDKKLLGPDHKASLEPGELKEMIKAIRNIEKALGDGIKKPNKSEIEIIKVARRSLIANRDIRVGEIIKESDIIIKRPGTGITLKFKEIVIGMRIINDIRQDEPFRWENFK
jgi:N-acetylneuraminate synthase/N,N'-diacetyllegionaminate synthase